MTFKKSVDDINFLCKLNFQYIWKILRQKARTDLIRFSIILSLRSTNGTKVMIVTNSERSITPYLWKQWMWKWLKITICIALKITDMYTLNLQFAESIYFHSFSNNIRSSNYKNAPPLPKKKHFCNWICIVTYLINQWRFFFFNYSYMSLSD